MINRFSTYIGKIRNRYGGRLIGNTPPIFALFAVTLGFLSAITTAISLVGGEDFSAYLTLAIVGLLISSLILYGVYKALDYFRRILIALHTIQDAVKHIDFRKRGTYFAGEKRAISGVFPDILRQSIRNIINSNDDLVDLLVILDSGSSIAPLIQDLHKVSPINASREVSITYITNNMEGIETTRQEVELLGGLPLHNYRATVGEATIKSLRSFGEKRRNSPRTTEILVVTTGNWVLIGEDLNQIRLLAKPTDHVNIKNEMINIASMVIVVAPLPKLLPNNSPTKINKARNDKNNEYILCDPFEEKVLLVTTKRDPGDDSSFKKYFQEIVSVSSKDRNFELSDKCPTFSPKEFVISCNREPIPTALVECEFPIPFIETSKNEIYGDHIV